MRDNLFFCMIFESIFLFKIFENIFYMFHFILKDKIIEKSWTES